MRTSRRPQSRTTKDRIRQSMLARYARLREASRIHAELKKNGVVFDEKAQVNDGRA